MMNFVYDHQVIAEQLQLFQMFGPGNGLNAGNGDRSTPFVAACSYLPDNRHRVDQVKLLRRLLQQLLTVSDDERIEAKTTGDISKDNGLATARRKDNQCAPSLWLVLVGSKDTFNTDFLIGAQGDKRPCSLLGQC